MRRAGFFSIMVVTLSLAGCQDPLARDSTATLRRMVIEAQRRQLDAAGTDAPTAVRAERGDSYLEADPKRRAELDKISGPQIYDSIKVDRGPGLDGKPLKTVSLSLRQAITSAVRNNLGVRVARLQPAVSEAQIVAAEAVFDATFFMNASYGKTDQPSTRSSIDPSLAPFGFPFVVNETANFSTGIRKPLETGGQIELSTGFDYANTQTPGQSSLPDPAWTSNLTLSLTQPLLRNFGAPALRSQIALTRNAHRRDVLTLHAQLLAVVTQVEQAYWQLAFAHHLLAVQQRLNDMTVETRDKIKARQEYDVNPVQMSQAQSFVDQRRGDLIRARRAVADASDQLKQLMQHKDLPLAGETLIVPTDAPVEVAVQYSLLDAVTTALAHRPEMRSAILNIDDASIRQMIADNQRLPILDLSAQMNYSGLDDKLDGSYTELGEAHFIDYLLALQFEAPIGNRRAEADWQRTRLQRRQAVVSYAAVGRDVVRDVKGALRGLREAWALIGAARAERRAAAENLRALLEREDKGEALTPEFLLDLKLSTQQRVADASVRELQALVDYNNALAQLHLVTGTALEHNQIDFNWPEQMFQK